MDERTVPSIYDRFIGKRCFLMLKEPWIGITFPLNPVTHPEKIMGPDNVIQPNPRAGQIVAIPFLAGKILSEAPDAIYLESEDPNPNNRDCVVEVLIPKDHIHYVTTVRRNTEE